LPRDVLLRGADNVHTDFGCIALLKFGGSEECPKLGVI